MDITQIVVLVLALVAGVAIGYVVKGRKIVFDSFPKDWDWVLDEAVRTAIKAAEQLYTSEQGGEKLAYAISYVEKYLEKYGLELDPVLIRGAIEAAVHDLKDAVEAADPELEQN